MCDLQSSVLKEIKEISSCIAMVPSKAGDNNCLLFAELEVLPESELRVVNTNEFDDFDVASFVVESPAGAPRAKERGFVGTVLAGSIS